MKKLAALLAVTLVLLVTAEARAQAQSQIGMGEVIQMAQAHVSDSVIISQIRTSGTVFHLTGQEVLTLKQSGVSDAVVQEMQATAYRQPRRVYTAAPVYGPPPAVSP